jgi:hypothetical protein
MTAKRSREVPNPTSEHYFSVLCLKWCSKNFRPKLLFYVLLTTLIILGLTRNVNAITSGEAVEASKSAAEVQKLINQNPTSSYAMVSSTEWKGVESWKVMWWTEVQFNSGLNYPNLMVYVRKSDAEILEVLTPRGSDQEYLFPDKVTLEASKATVNLDLKEQVTLSGMIHPSNVTTVIIQYRTLGGNWSLLDTIISKDDGSYSYVWTPPLGSYQVRSRTISATSGALTIQAIPEFSRAFATHSIVFTTIMIVVMLIARRNMRKVYDEGSHQRTVHCHSSILA